MLLRQGIAPLDPAHQKMTVGGMRHRLGLHGGIDGQACGRVGMSKQSAYALRRGQDAKSFREAWDAALQYAVQRLSDAVLARAIHGQAIPHYFKGEVVGEHRRYDNRLATFLLRYRDPQRFSKMVDYKEFAGTYGEIPAPLSSLRSRPTPKPLPFREGR
jgi:hypothetical protein